MKKNIVFLIGAVLVVAMASLLYAPTTENSPVAASMTVNGFIDTTINISAISFGSVDPNTTLNPANSSVNLSSTSNSNALIDVYLNNSNMNSGGNSILFNLTSVNTVNNNATITRLNGTPYINGTTGNTGFYENLPINGSVILWFWQDVPIGQAAGAYTEALNIRAVSDGTAP